jgi:chromosome segregation and condensation protein ScpB
MTKENSTDQEKVEISVIQHSFKKPIDFLVYQLRSQFLDLSMNELKLLALIALKGVTKTTKVTAVREGIFKSEQTVANALSKFRKENILDSEDFPVLLCPLITKREGILKIEIKLG